MSMYTLYAVQVGTSPTLKGIVGQDVDPALDLIIRTADGAQTPTFGGVMRATPRVGLETVHVDDALAITGASGAANSGPVIFSFQLMASGGGRTPASGKKLTAAAGRFIPRRITASNGQLATMALDFLGTNSTGLVAPFIYADACPTIATQNMAVGFTLGPVKINNTEIADVISATLDFGIRERYRFASGAPYPSDIIFEEWIPTLRIRTHELGSLATYGVTGVSDDVVLYLREKPNHGAVTLEASSAHVKLTLSQAYITAGPASGRNAQPGEMELTCSAEYDGTNAALLATYDQAIT